MRKMNEEYKQIIFRQRDRKEPKEINGEVYEYITPEKVVPSDYLHKKYREIRPIFWNTHVYISSQERTKINSATELMRELYDKAFNWVPLRGIYIRNVGLYLN